MLFSCFSKSTNLPSSIMARWGYVWLPIGRPSGLADAVSAPASTNPAAVAPAAVVSRNSRLVIMVAVRSFLRGSGRGTGPARECKRAEDRGDDDVLSAVFVEVDDVEGRAHAGFVVHEFRHEAGSAGCFRVAHGPVDAEHRIARWIVVRQDVVPGLRPVALAGDHVGDLVAVHVGEARAVGFREHHTAH